MDDVNKADGRIVPGMRLATSRLIDRLRTGKVGDTCTDEELSGVCERNTRVGENGYGYLQSAIRHVLRHYELVWKRIPGANAIRCLGASETIDLAKSKTRSIARQARRTTVQLKAVATEVTEENRTAYLVSVAQAGTLAQMASDAGRKKLEARGITSPLDLGRLLENMQDVSADKD